MILKKNTYIKLKSSVVDLSVVAVTWPSSIIAPVLIKDFLKLRIGS